VVVVAFQIIFCTEMHANDIFLFFKNYFWHEHIKTIQNILNFSKKKLNFLETRFAPRYQTVSMNLSEPFKSLIMGIEEAIKVQKPSFWLFIYFKPRHSFNFWRQLCHRVKKKTEVTEWVLALFCFICTRKVLTNCKNLCGNASENLFKTWLQFKRDIY